MIQSQCPACHRFDFSDTLRHGVCSNCGYVTPKWKRAARALAWIAGVVALVAWVL